jgi:hypothetical protein
MTEQEILERYSTPGLRRNVLTRTGKKAHLQTMPRITPDEIEEILARLYPQCSGLEAKPTISEHDNDPHAKEEAA